MIANSSELRTDHHYLAQSYLKAWAGEDGRLSVYRLLVSHPNVPLWRHRTPKGVAYHRHLYTRIIEGEESDEIEHWLASKVEAPAQEALEKLRSDQPLSARDWKRLMRFVAAHDVRTPAMYLKRMRKWQVEIPEVIEEALEETVKRLKNSPEAGTCSEVVRSRGVDLIPMRIIKETDEVTGTGCLGAEVTAGRGLWLFEIKRVLNHTYKVLWKHRWSVLPPPNGSEWFTSDAPVIRLNYYGDSYDFKGGWASAGSEIIFPVSPNHLLYTKIGDRTRVRELGDDLGHRIQRFIAEHAFRFVYARRPLDIVEQSRPRNVDKERFLAERDEWRRWHADQTAAEQ